MRNGGFNEPTELFYISATLFAVGAIALGVGASGTAATIGAIALSFAIWDWFYTRR